MGTIIVDSGDLTEEEVVNTLISLLSNELSIHPADIEILYEEDDGIAIYIIISDNAETLTDIINHMHEDDFMFTSEEISIDSFNPPEKIILNVDVTVDVSTVSDADIIVDTIVQDLQTQNPNFAVEGLLQFITPAPSRTPTVKPTTAPVTSMPSATPSISGWVVTISAKASVSTPIRSDDIEAYASNLAELYGVDESDIKVAMLYETTGSIELIIPEAISEIDLTDAITTSIAESLGVHAADVDVIVDMETGDVEFTITSDSFNQAASVQFDLSNDRTQEAIFSAIESFVPTLAVDGFEVNDDVVASIEFVVDANDAHNDLTQAAWQSEQLLQDFDVSVKSKFKIV